MSTWRFTHAADHVGVVGPVSIVDTTDDAVMTRAGFLDALDSSADFRKQLSGFLSSQPFDGMAFETPVWRAGNLGAAFEFVCVDMPPLAQVAPNASAFTEHIASSKGGVASFHNISGDATMVAPAGETGVDDFGHLLSFLRSADAQQQHAVWRGVAAAMRLAIAAGPTWLSTAGLGVPWLHWRISQRPKYYRYSPYTSVAG